ncbi:MAG: TraB/GumN family protein [Ferruginibacter sp.]
MDEYVKSIGKNNSKELYGFETDSFQMQLLATSFSKYSWDFAKRNVPVILKLYRNEKVNEVMCLSFNKYAALDVDYKFKDSCNSFKGNILTNDEFIKNRNDAWIVQLPKLLENNNCFIAVGFAHLCNQCGLIQQIKALGYEVDPVTMK